MWPHGDLLGGTGVQNKPTEGLLVESHAREVMKSHQLNPITLTLHV